MRALFSPHSLTRLRRDTRAVTAVEFAFVLPLLLTAGLGGIELANIAVTHMRINQIAVSLADNASRMKQETVNGAPRIREYDVNQAFVASQLQAKGLDFKRNGRLILSSLKVNGDGGQYIQWQRCQGDKLSEKSAYGNEGTGKTGSAFPGMGPAGYQVKAESGSAIMVAEVAYDYQTIVPYKFFGDQTIRKFAAMTVRDDRDLSEPGIFNPSPTAPKSGC